nr:MAG TPA: hypothetical protein [Caudoviricetes sp.]
MNKSLDELLRLPDSDFKVIFENETLGNVKSCINLVKSLMVEMSKAYKAVPKTETDLVDDMEFLMANLQDKLNILEAINKEKQEKRKLKFDLPIH